MTPTNNGSPTAPFDPSAADAPIQTPNPPAGIRKVGLAMRRAARNVYEAHGRCGGELKTFSMTLICLTFLSLGSFVSMRATAQVSAAQMSALSPPINHEAGRIEEIITAAADGFRFRGYVLTWRSMRIVVAGAPDESYRSGDNLDVVVYRTEVAGQKVLRFAASPSASNENMADRESVDSSASVTLGTARIEETISADSDGYRFVAYVVTWHDQRVFVVDPQSAPIRAIGDTINFRVLRTGLGASQRLTFSF
jgi:hypothetical protein